MKTGAILIKEERERQMELEKYSFKHDDRHNSRELASAALSYLGHYVARAWVYTNELEMPGVIDGPDTYKREEPPQDWPWNDKDWKPKDPMRDLIRAGALIAAEIDRLNRVNLK